MWTCPKCGRSFQRQNQGHYCGSAPADINQYIAVQEESCQKRLQELTEIIREVAPNAKESIKWSMPSFQNGPRTLQFAACQAFISLYVGADIIDMFHDHLDGLSYKKDALYLPYDKPLSTELIKNMVKRKLSEKDNC